MVEWLKPSAGPTLRLLVRQVCTVARTLPASTLPSSTPHWSNELMPQMKPCKPMIYSAKSLQLCNIPCTGRSAFVVPGALDMIGIVWT